MPDDLSLPLAQAAPGGAHVGGLVGYTCGSKLDYTNNFGSVSNSYARGSVSGTSDVGGLVGYNSDYGLPISNSYSTGHLSGKTFVVNIGPPSVYTVYAALNLYQDHLPSHSPTE